MFKKQSIVPNQAGVIGAGKFCAKFAILVVLIAIFASIGSHNLHAVELPELTKQQLQTQNLQLKDFLNKHKLFKIIFNGTYFGNTHKLTPDKLKIEKSCKRFFDSVKAAKSFDLPSFDYVATDRSEEYLAWEYIKQKIIDTGRLRYDSIQDKNYEYYDYILFSDAENLVYGYFNYFKVTSEYLPVFDIDSFIALQDRQVWVKKYQNYDYPTIFEYRPDNFQPDSIFSFSIRGFKNYSADATFHGIGENVQYLTKNNFANLPKIYRH